MVAKSTFYSLVIAKSFLCNICTSEVVHLHRSHNCVRCQSPEGSKVTPEKLVLVRSCVSKVFLHSLQVEIFTTPTYSTVQDSTESHYTSSCVMTCTVGKIKSNFYLRPIGPTAVNLFPLT